LTLPSTSGVVKVRTCLFELNHAAGLFGEQLPSPPIALGAAVVDAESSLD
jgi:hypothetical protein